MNFEYVTYTVIILVIDEFKVKETFHSKKQNSNSQVRYYEITKH